MKTNKPLVALGLALASLAGMETHAQNTQFTLANNTGFTVRSVFIWRSADTYQGPDRLGNNMIPSGEYHEFRPRNGGCTYNVRITLLNEDDEYQWDDVDLCDLSRLTLNYNYLDRQLWSNDP